MFFYEMLIVGCIIITISLILVNIINTPYTIKENDIILLNDVYLNIDKISIFKGFSFDTATLYCKSFNGEPPKCKEITTDMSIIIKSVKTQTETRMVIAHIKYESKNDDTFTSIILIDDDHFG